MLHVCVSSDMAASAASEISTSLPTISAVKEQRIFCRVCQEQYAKYTCPRCNLRYCCLHCYKAHSLRCTESFSRENVLAEMKDLTVTDESKRKMVDTLKRIHFDDQGRSILDDLEDVDTVDTSDGFLSESTLQRLSQGGEFSLECLTVEERRAFLRAVAAGELSHMIKPWEPWWYSQSAHSISLTKQGTRRVQVLEHDDDSCSDAASAEVPSPPVRPLVPVSFLTSVKPSPLLVFHVVEVLYSYSFILRLFNGDWRSDALDAALTFLNVSAVLGEAFAPESVCAALTACMEKICSPVLKHTGGYRFGVALYDDTTALLKLGKEAVICALADSHRILETAQKEFKVRPGIGREEQGVWSNTVDAASSKVQASSPRPSSSKKGRSGASQRHSIVKRLESAVRKTYFLTCWTNEQPSDSFSSLVLLVGDEKKKLSEIHK